MNKNSYNVETVNTKYERSLEVLKRLKELGGDKIKIKLAFERRLIYQKNHMT